MAFLTRMLLLFYVLSIVQALGGMRGSAGSGRSSKYAASRPAASPGYSQYPSQNTPKEPIKSQTSSQRRGLGISAWGLIALVISVIVCSMGAYYFIIFYPLLCKKQRNYDKMELSPV